jgi:hypothetical protein
MNHVRYLHSLAAAGPEASESLSDVCANVDDVIPNEKLTNLPEAYWDTAPFHVLCVDMQMWLAAAAAVSDSGKLVTSPDELALAHDNATLAKMCQHNAKGRVTRRAKSNEVPSSTTNGGTVRQSALCLYDLGIARAQYGPPKDVICLQVSGHETTGSEPPPIEGN